MPLLTVLAFVFGVVFKTKWGADRTTNGSLVLILLLELTINNIFAELMADRANRRCCNLLAKTTII